MAYSDGNQREKTKTGGSLRGGGGQTLALKPSGPRKTQREKKGKVSLGIKRNVRERSGVGWGLAPRRQFSRAYRMKRGGGGDGVKGIFTDFALRGDVPTVVEALRISSRAKKRDVRGSDKRGKGAHEWTASLRPGLKRRGKKTGWEEEAGRIKIDLKRLPQGLTSGVLALIVVGG